MKDSASSVAFGAIILLGGALGAVVYLGTRAGPSTPPGTAPSVASGSSAPPTPAGSGSAAPAAAPNAGPPTGFVASADLTADEQVIVERINEVRTNPPAFLPEWRQQFAREPKSCDEPPTLLDPLASYAARQPLAPNQALTIAARKHAHDMIDRDYFGHVNPDGIAANKRAIAAGFPLPVDRPLTPDNSAYGNEDTAQNIESIYMHETTAPNRAWRGLDWKESVDELIIDSCVPTRGHRDHLLGVGELGAAQLEVGIGAANGAGKSKPGSKLTVAVEIAMRGDSLRFITGVVYRDANANKKYDHGEGVPNIDVTFGAVSTKTAPGGGYALPVAPDAKGDVVASGAKVPVELHDQNIKVDFTAQ